MRKLEKAPDGHAVYMCRHGVVTRQCRCPARDKPVRLDPCPPECDPVDEQTKDVNMSNEQPREQPQEQQPTPDNERQQEVDTGPEGEFPGIEPTGDGTSAPQ